MKYRYEKFGGIISNDDPPFLAYVDRDYMTGCGLPSSELWNCEDKTPGILVAPTEVHFAITNRCSVGCGHCYMNGGKPDDHELSTAEMKSALDIVAGMGVFHVAMGGGEALEREALFVVAGYARQIGLVPNLTISGMGITPRIALRMTVFGQVNISVDGIGDAYGVYRGRNLFETADCAFDLLTAAGISTGINCVIGRRNFGEIENIFRYAASKKLSEIEFLRYKPSGRGKDDFLENRTTFEQNTQLVHYLSEFSKKYLVTAKIDCSFVPMLCYARPSKRLLRAIATYGCEAGNVLLGIRSNGLVSGCSFLENDGLTVYDLASGYDNHFGEFRNWTDHAKEPCRSCKYLDICKGGCHAVSKFITGEYASPDPECPFVVEYLHGKKRK